MGTLPVSDIQTSFQIVITSIIRFVAEASTGENQRLIGKYALEYAPTRVIFVESGLDDTNPLAKLVDSLSRVFEGTPSTV